MSEFYDVYCPHCGEGINERDWELGDGDELEMDCECGKTFRVRTSVSINYFVVWEDE